jgi:phosphatidylglycerophosphatase A
MMTSLAPTSIPSRHRTLWAWTIATFFGAGLGKSGPGTWESAAAVLLWVAAAWGLHPTASTVLLPLFAFLILSLILGIPAATIVASETGRKDPEFVAIDEVAGQWIDLLRSRVGWHHALIALVLFRFVDIIKPFPVRQLEKLPKGWVSSSMMWRLDSMLGVQHPRCIFGSSI